MKLVKKLLRLLPFIFLILSFIVGAFSIKFEYTDPSITGAFTSSLYDYIYSYFDWFNSYFTSAFIDTTFYPLFDFFNEWLFDGGGSVTLLFNIPFCILVYELYLSLFFLCFDVFNFMLAIANKWITKGGNYD